MKYTGCLPTTYNGIAFRSRLEARWAVFFDTLKIQYKYEPARLAVVPHGYTPDFLIPLQDRFDRVMWIEVKPSDYESHDIDKPDALACEQIPVAFIHEPFIPAGDFDACVHSIYFGGACDYDHGFCQCSRCGKIGFEFESRSSRLGCGCWSEADSEEWTGASSELVEAYKTAVLFRFVADGKFKILK